MKMDLDLNTDDLIKNYYMKKFDLMNPYCGLLEKQNKQRAYLEKFLYLELLIFSF